LDVTPQRSIASGASGKRRAEARKLATEDRGNNGSAFLSRLPLRAKSAMAEILVSDFCDDRTRTPATAAGRSHLRHRPGEADVRRKEKRKSQFPVNRL
jgi:hypothetical protein